MLGEFGDDDFEGEVVVAKGVFFIATLVMTVIMLNLVIAIMSDTYEKVITSIGDSDNKQLNSMILTFEDLKFWARGHGSDEPKHLFWYEYAV